ncbi:MFS transporter [Bacillus luteolus]|uniref:MFS transporter n=1 Tax=Litchfieldia luteola TaxID=682179 RepID=A0ABR9QIP6_9BACI|nr:MFS transporter [Cytobacillus luteolus]MBE4908377.1 MFS transporter [Cytobacillus luteolus]MBP1943165.1 MFS family permease [Cytobacillus luteolus]
MENHKKLKWLIITQSSVFFASSLIFPFYILFINNIGSNYSQFGLSYGLFALSAALVHPIAGRLSSKFDNQYFLLVNSWGMALVLLYYPHISSIEQVYILQLLLGIFGALQKHGEKTLIASLTDDAERGINIGNYHFWTSIFSAIAIFFGGVLADFFTIHIIFYSSSIIYFVSGLLIYRTNILNKKEL